MKVGEKRRESERDFYLESFHSPLTSITPLDFHRLMGVKLRTDEEDRQIWDQRLCVRRWMFPSVSAEILHFCKLNMIFYFSVPCSVCMWAGFNVSSSRAAVTTTAFHCLLNVKPVDIFLYIYVCGDWSRYLSWIITEPNVLCVSGL